MKRRGVRKDHWINARKKKPATDRGTKACDMPVCYEVTPGTHRFCGNCLASVSKCRKLSDRERQASRDRALLRLSRIEAAESKGAT